MKAIDNETTLIPINLSRLGQGFTLVEMLVSVVILAVGILGSAALQTSAVKYTQSADQRAEAVLLAYDMADRIRANIGEIDNYSGTDSTTSYTAGLQLCLQDENASPVADCTTSQMLQYDQWRWSQNIQSLLPSGIGQINRKTSLDGTAYLYEINLQWKDKSSNVADSFTLVLQT